MTDKLTLRELRGDDIFPILDILGKLDVADKLVAEFAETTDAPKAAPKDASDAEKAAAKTAQDKFTRARGIRIAGVLGKVLLANLGKVREDVNRLLADLTGTDVPTIKGLGLGAYIGLVKALVTNPEFAEVFTSAATSKSTDDDAS